MKDNDELFTIEINVNPYAAEKKSEVPADVKSEDKLQENNRGQFVLFEEAERKREEQKHKEYLRLRDAIFNRNRGPVNSTFIQQAAQYADDEGEPTEYVPFSCYWPTYDVMSAAQLKWYFYWRGQVRNGIFPQTSLSYIFIYVYEIINEIGITDKEDGFLRLCSLWGEYRAHYSNIDRYLGMWVGDYITINFPDGLPEELLDRITNPDIIGKLPDNIVINHIFNSPETEINGSTIFDFMLKCSNYKLKSSKFYLSGYQFMTEYYLTGAFVYLNKYMKKKTGKAIFETYKTNTTQRKMPYQNAVYQGKVKWIESSSEDYSKNKALREFVTAVIKETENCLRGITGYKGKLKSGLDEEYARILRKYIKEKYNNKKLEERAKISIDKTKIRQLIDNSEIIRDKLLADNPETEQEIIDEEEITEEEPETDETVIHSNGDFGSLTEKLSEVQQKILDYIKENGGEVSSAELADAFSGVFVQMELDNINEAAMDCLGDILLLTEGDSVQLLEI